MSDAGDFLNLIGAVGTGVANYESAQLSEEAAKRALDYAKQSATQQMPWDTTSALGQASFDYTYDPTSGRLTDQSITQSLSPDLQTEYDRLLAKSRATQQQLSPWEADPEEARRGYYSQYKSAIAPQQQAEQRALENRLLAQGMLGSTGGQGRLNALLKAQQQADQTAMFQAEDRAQQLVDKYRTRASQDLTQATNLGTLPSSLASLGSGQGTTTGSGLSAVTAAMTDASTFGLGGQAMGNKALAGMFSNLGGLFSSQNKPTGG
jgi:hypothetical protein